MRCDDVLCDLADHLSQWIVDMAQCPQFETFTVEQARKYLWVPRVMQAIRHTRQSGSPSQVRKLRTLLGNVASRQGRPPKEPLNTTAIRALKLSHTIRKNTAFTQGVNLYLERKRTGEACRDCRRAHSLRGWTHGTTQQIFS